ncbi:hypothetical protein [Kribbella ginsengisoli]|uniref:hypothetical protein n=1 Tax=Kribbella ginsengisoli TaxID=363865 RepID=UPI0031E30B7F
MAAVLLAYLGNTKTPPAASTQGFIALVSIVAQVGAGMAFSKDGKADPTHAQRSIGRLLTTAQRAKEARLLAEALYERKVTAAELRFGLGQLSTHLSYLEDGYAEAIADWGAFSPLAMELAARSRPAITESDKGGNNA